MPQQSSQPKKKTRKEPSVLFNITQCSYPVIYDAAKARGWNLHKNQEEDDEETPCNIYWVDVTDVYTQMRKIQPWQKINHFPGMSSLARKDRLAKNMVRMQKEFPKEYSFFPKTWVLPSDSGDFRAQFGNDGLSNKTFILKPAAGCQGRGIFLTRDIKEVNLKEGYVAQRYIKKPLLIDGFKFDLRLYILVLSADPLRVYFFNDGLTRLCTTQYVKPTNENLSERCMHLTNYAINKLSDNFQFNEDADDDGAGSKRSLRWFMEWLADTHGQDKADMVWGRMADVVNKMLIAVAPLIRAESMSGMAHGHTKGMPSRSFEILGVDVMIDQNLKPWLIEVNHLPSFKCDTPLDKDIKSRLIEQTLAMIECSGWDRRRYQNATKEKARIRLQAGIEKSKRERQLKEEMEAKIAAIEARRCGRRPRPRQQQPPPLPNSPAPSVLAAAAAEEAAAGARAGLGVGAEADERERGKRRSRPQPPLVQVERSRSSIRESYSADGHVGEQGAKSKSPSTPTSPSTSSSAGVAGTTAGAVGQGEEQEQQRQSEEQKEEEEEDDDDDDDDDDDEDLVDFERIFPPPASNAYLKAIDYQHLIAKASEQFEESQVRLRAPLQQKKGEQLDEKGGTAMLPPIVKKQEFGRDCFGHAMTDRRYDAVLQRQRLTTKPSAAQVDMANRLMHGYSSKTGEHISKSAPATLYQCKDRAARDGVAYGLAYQKKIQQKQTMPTMKLKTCSIGFGNDLSIGF